MVQDAVSPNEALAPLSILRRVVEMHVRCPQSRMKASDTLPYRRFALIGFPRIHGSFARTNFHGLVVLAQVVLQNVVLRIPATGQDTHRKGRLYWSHHLYHLHCEFFDQQMIFAAFGVCWVRWGWPWCRGSHRCQKKGQNSSFSNLTSHWHKSTCLSFSLPCQRLVPCNSDLYCSYWEYCQISSLQCTFWKEPSLRSRHSNAWFLKSAVPDSWQSPSTGDLGPVGCLMETQHASTLPKRGENNRTSHSIFDTGETDLWQHLRLSKTMVIQLPMVSNVYGCALQEQFVVIHWGLRAQFIACHLRSLAVKAPEFDPSLN